MADHENFTYIPITGDGLSIVGRVLGTRIGSNTALCCHKNINKHSRRKPYWFGADGVELYGKSGTDENVIKSHNFGLTPKLIGMPAKSAQNASGCIVPWGQWRAPEPNNESDHKGIQDFLGYWHPAGPHILSFDTVQGTWINPSQDLSVTVTFESEYLDRIVTLYDIAYKEGTTALSIGDMRLTVLICTRGAASYGTKWIIAQSAYTVAEVNNRAATLVPVKKMFKLEVLINLYGAIGTRWKSFSDCFLAVGFAPLLPSEKTDTPFSSITKATAVGYNDVYYCTMSSTPSALPLKLVNPDMYNNGWQVAKFCTMQPPTSGAVYFDVYVKLTVPPIYQQSERPRCTYSSTTKNGKSGISVNISGHAYCTITSVADGYASKGYIVFVFNVDTDIGSFYYYAMMRKGCAAGVGNEKALHMSGSRVTNTDDLAPNDFDATEAKKWLVEPGGTSTEAEDMKDLSKGEGIFIAGATEVRTVLLYIDAAPSELIGNAIAIPTIRKDDNGLMSYELKKY
ncbi:MAG: hypothetical protein K2K00_03710 [Muribaculaceae bacterium]|nr:hypothetical protein [Muribaculaceae bacterium]